MKSDSDNNPPWYQEGLRFECSRCGKCCTRAGYVWLEPDEVDELATHLKMDPITFEKVYTRKVGRSLSLRDQASGACIFYSYEKKGCSVYEARPSQCKTWPFWEQNIHSPQQWEKTKQFCPGSGEGQLHTLEDITAKLKMTRL